MLAIEARKAGTKAIKKQTNQNAKSDHIAENLIWQYTHSERLRLREEIWQKHLQGIETAVLFSKNVRSYTGVSGVFLLLLSKRLVAYINKIITSKN